MMPNTSRRAIHICQCRVCRSHPDSRVAQEHRAINRVLASLDERARRHFAGVLATQMGWGGVLRLAQITGLSRNTIRRGQAEIRTVKPRTGARLRKRGGGRWPVEKNIRAC